MQQLVEIRVVVELAKARERGAQVARRHRGGPDQLLEVVHATRLVEHGELDQVQLLFLLPDQTPGCFEV